MTQTGTPQKRSAAIAGPHPSSDVLSLVAAPDPADGEPGEEAGGVLEASGLTTVPERQFAAMSWLLGAAVDRDLARVQWDEQGIALLCCGGILSAVRIPARLVWAAVKTDQLEKVDAFLGEWFDGGAVFMDLRSQQYYALVPGTADWPLNDRDFPGVQCLGRDNFLGVTASRLTTPEGRAYWCLPMQSPGDLCYLDEVEALVRTGPAALAEGGGQ
ncbi:hypothetical protein [Streptomyces albogriseolus]|uniref:hypothetical protein n=1 Tax=Streptomyces albogriseolus TaxID=1887 RepID=UPI003D713991